MTLSRNGPIESLAESLLSVQYPNAWLESQFEGTQKTNREHMIEKLVKDLKWGCPVGLPPISGVAGQLSAVARHYVPTAALRRLKRHMSSQGSPIIVIVGSEDLLVRTENSELLCNALRCPLVKVDTSGHMIHLQVPHVFNTTLQSHFDNYQPKQLPTQSDLPKAKL